MKKAYARILAGMIPPEELVAFRFICGKGEGRTHATPEVVDNLVALELVKRAQSIEDHPRELVLLTSKGKQIAEYV